MRDLLSVFTLLAILGAIIKFILAIWVVVVVVAGVAGVAAVTFAGVKLTEFWLVRHDEKCAAKGVAALAERARVQEVVRRAHQQNQLYLAGEDVGIYGEYPPADLR